MKKLFAVIVVLVVFVLGGCASLNTGVNVSKPVIALTEGAFVWVLQDNPSYKAPVIAGLTAVKTFLSGAVTYDDLILYIPQVFGDKYKFVGVILKGFLDTDKPLFETHLTLFDAYKTGVIKKIDELILLAKI